MWGFHAAPVAPALFNDQGHTRKFMCRVPRKIGVPPPDQGNVMQGQERTGEPVGSRDAGRASCKRQEQRSEAGMQ
jgi:hypothetical protein